MSSCHHDNGPARLRGNAGLTIVELLVALSIASIIMFGIYSVYSVSADTYRIQNEIMEAMDQARFGLEQVKRDISKAAFLGTPNSVGDAMVCPKPGNPIRGIIVERSGAVVNPGFNRNIQPNGMIMFGSYWSDQTYLTRSVVGSTVTLQTAADGAPFPATREEFEGIFTQGRFLRIVNAEQYEGYYLIQSSDFGSGTIQLQSPVTTATPPNYCGIQGFGVGLEASVAGWVRYRLIADPLDADGLKIDLVRHELLGSDPLLQTVVANSGITMAEYVVDLQLYDFVVDTDRSGRAPLLVNLQHVDAVLDGGTQKLDMSADARPQDLRFVTVKLTTRTVHEDEKFQMIQRQALFTPIEAYDLDPIMEGAARTVSLSSRVGLKTFLVRNVK